MAAAALKFNTLRPGDAFPWVGQRSPSMPHFAVDTIAGRYIVMCFFGTLADAGGRAAIEAMEKNRALFDDQRACFFGVSVDPQDEAQKRIAESMPGVRVLWDFNEEVSKACGIVPAEPNPARGPKAFRRWWIVVDPTLHVLAAFPFQDGAGGHEQVFEFLRGLPPPGNYAGFEIPAPVLVLPNVLEPDLCRHLIALYKNTGGKESGVVRDNAGVMDASFKRRKDFHIADERLVGALRDRLLRRAAPQIRKLFFMEITQIERYIVGCYAAEDGGHFRPHRDNGAGLTAHRRFAVSINLNDDFEGGAVRFPEYNLRGIKAPPGWAVIFPCAILHAVSRVTSGQRYAFLPFVYDDEGVKIREANQPQRAQAPKAEPERQTNQAAG